MPKHVKKKAKKVAPKPKGMSDREANARKEILKKVDKAKAEFKARKKKKKG